MACSSCGKPAKGAAVLATLTMGADAAASSARPCSLPTRPGRRHLVGVRVRVTIWVTVRVRVRVKAEVRVRIKHLVSAGAARLRGPVRGGMRRSSSCSGSLLSRPPAMLTWGDHHGTRCARTVRPRLVREPGTYSTWGKPPCASGTYTTREAGTYPTEAPGRTCPLGWLGLGLGLGLRLRLRLRLG